MRLILTALFLAVSSTACGSETCGTFKCDSFKFFPEPQNARSDKSIYSCISTDSQKVTSYTLKDGNTVLVECEDAENQSDCRFRYNDARETACKK